MFILIDIDASSDESDYLLAPWFDEQVNTTNASAEVSSANTTQIIDTTFELDSNKTYNRVSFYMSNNYNFEFFLFDFFFFKYIDLIIEILNLYERLMLTLNSKNSIIKHMQQSFDEKQIKDLANIINEIENKFERLPDRFINTYLKFIQSLIFKDILDHDRQVSTMCC